MGPGNPAGFPFRRVRCRPGAVAAGASSGHRGRRFEPFAGPPRTYGIILHNRAAGNMYDFRRFGPQGRVVSLPASLLASALVSATMAGCGSGGGGSGGGTPPPPDPEPPASFDPVFSEIQEAVFTPICTACHAGPAAPQGLQLDEDNSYAMLVDVPSTEVPSILRVAPGDPDNSYLIQKLEGTASVGDRMPLNQPPLDQADIDVIRQWITDGAVDDRASSVAAVRVASLSPVPGGKVTAAPDRIIAAFDRELDASTVNANTFIVEASGGDGTFSDGNERQVAATAIVVSAANARSARFELGETVLADDVYRVRLLGSGPSMILDLAANALDGEFRGTTPAGDGIQGGDFTAEFVVDSASQPGGQ